MSSDFVNVVLENGMLCAATQGELFCLDPATGELRWHNKLKGRGRGLVTVAWASAGSGAVLREKQRRDEAATAAVPASASAV